MREDIALLLLEAVIVPEKAPAVALHTLNAYRTLQPDDVEGLFSILRPWWDSVSASDAAWRLVLVDTLNNLTWRRSKAHLQIARMYRELVNREAGHLSWSFRQGLNRMCEQTALENPAQPLWGELTEHGVFTKNLVVDQLGQGLVRNNLPLGSFMSWVENQVWRRAHLTYLGFEQEHHDARDRMYQREVPYARERVQELLDRHFSLDQLKEGYLKAYELRRKRALMAISSENP